MQSALSKWRFTSNPSHNNSVCDSISKGIFYRPTRNFHDKIITTPNALKGVQNCFSCLPRSIVKIEGPDAANFLQSLTTNNIVNLTTQQEGAATPNALFTGFLNAQGRVVFDAFMIKGLEPNSFLLDVDATLGAEMLAHLKRYKLRSKVTFTDVSNDLKVWSVFGKDSMNVKQLEDSVNTDKKITFIDPRTSAMGFRAIIPAGITPQLSSSFAPVDSSIYHLYRILTGIPEGPKDLPSAHSLPFESNFEYTNAVAYNKGCYLGQELTARTHYTGVIRKRLMPLVIEEDYELTKDTLDSSVLFPAFVTNGPVKEMPPTDTNLVIGEHKTGKIHSTIFNVGLGMIRLEHIEHPDDLPKCVVKTEESGVKLRLWKPFWWDTYRNEQREAAEKIASQFKQ